MKINKAILIVIGIVIIGGGIGLSLSKKDSGSSDTGVMQNDAAASNDQAEGAVPTFNPKATQNESFVATIEGKSKDSTVITGSIESDGKGNIHFKGLQTGESAEYYLAADQAFIFCQGEKCYRYAENESGLNVGDYEVTDEDIAKYKETAKYIGEESCPEGTCDVWQYDDNGADTKIYINKQSKQVSQVIGVKDGETFKVVYEFKDVTVTIPTNVEEIINTFPKEP